MARVGASGFSSQVCGFGSARCPLSETGTATFIHVKCCRDVFSWLRKFLVTPFAVMQALKFTLAENLAIRVKNVLEDPGRESVRGAVLFLVKGGACSSEFAQKRQPVCWWTPKGFHCFFVDDIIACPQLCFSVLLWLGGILFYFNALYSVEQQLYHEVFSSTTGLLEISKNSHSHTLGTNADSSHLLFPFSLCSYIHPSSTWIAY